MHQPPPKIAKQSAESALADLEAQRARLDSSILWTRNVSEAIRALKDRGVVEFTNTGYVGRSARSAEVAFTLPTVNGVQDIPVFTIVCSYTPEEMGTLLADPMASLESLQQATHQRWLAAYSVRPFEVWTVPDRLIFREDETATAAWMSSQVKAWLAYWFGPYKVSYRQRRALTIDKATP